MGKGLAILRLKTALTVDSPRMEQIPKFKTRGNLHLPEEPLTALFCSARCPGDFILKTYDLARSMRDAGVAVIGGFQTPMKKECLRLLLRGTQPVVICPSRDIDNMQVPRDWRGPQTEGRLLVLSSFSATVRRATAESAARRNEWEASLAIQVFIAHAAPGSKTESFAQELAATGKSLLTLDSTASTNLVGVGALGVRPGSLPINLMERTSHGE